MIIDIGKTFLCTLLLALVASFDLHAQSNFAATVIDESNGEALPYVVVSDLRTKYTTYSDALGKVTIPDVQAGDSIVFFSIGYQKKYIVFQPQTNDRRIAMTPVTYDLKELVIRANDTFLYDLIEKAQRNAPKETATAKTYFQLGTKVNEQQVELVECYYNGTFEGGDISKLDLKNGRIALLPFDDRMYTSTEGSKSIYLHTLFSKNTYFPDSPLELRGKKLKQRFRLEYAGEYINEDKEKVCVIDFFPKKNQDHSFEGRIWMIEKTGALVKVEFRAKKTKDFPFAPIGTTDSLFDVSLFITKNFDQVRGKTRLRSIDFSYQFEYLNNLGTRNQLETSALLVPYDYQKLFTLPQFSFSTGTYEDYVKIQAVPYNEDFWDNNTEFVIEATRHTTAAFIENPAVLTNQTGFRTERYRSKDLLERGYVFWNDTTDIRFKTIDIDTAEYARYQLRPPVERYHIEVQLYMDVNRVDGQLKALTATIYDPFQSYYYFPITEEANAFINLYFDLVEMHRRKLEKLILISKTEEEILQQYSQIKLELNEASIKFFREVDRGTNASQMENWRRKIILQ
jgi:hypothetical protein